MKTKSVKSAEKSRLWSRGARETMPYEGTDGKTFMEIRLADSKLECSMECGLRSKKAVNGGRRAGVSSLSSVACGLRSGLRLGAVVPFEFAAYL